MNFYVMTLFPEMVEQGLNTSIIGRAKKNGLLNIEAVNIRDFANNKHNRVDDYPYGGGNGMLMQPGPVYDCYDHIQKQIGKKPRVVYLTPQGSTFSQKMVEDFAKEEDLVFLCGHYEGIDERVLEMVVTDYVSIGDYVLTGGELPAMVMIDAISRFVPGVLAEGSAEIESFHDNLLEYPQYTRPEEFMGKKVPEILLSGHHAKIVAWQREKSIERTLERRPDLLPSANLNKKEQQYLKTLMRGERKMKDQNCAYCMEGELVNQFGIKICELSVSKVYLFREQSHKGRVIVAYKDHVSEIVDISQDERAAFMEDIAKVAKAMHEIYHPDKVNYGAYGDTGCHLHVHLVPKYKDGFEWGGVFAMNPGLVTLTEEEYAEMVTAYKNALL